MAKDWGLKITKSGVATTTTDPRDMLFSTKYQMFKYHGEYTKSLVLNSGSSSVTGSVAHNLGYVPAFITYGVRSDNGANFIVPLCPPHIGMEGVNACDFITVDTWADINNIYYKVETPFGKYHVYNYYADEYYDEWTGARNQYKVGRDNDFGGSRSGAMRFIDVEIVKSATITSAVIDTHIRDKGDAAGDVKIKTYGIDEDNTGDFGSNPMGRTKTTACESQNVAAGAGSNFGINVIDEVREITTRGGWSSGNAMGFILNDDSNINDAWIQDYYDPSQSWLAIQLPGSVTVSFRTIVFKDKIHD